MNVKHDLNWATAAGAIKRGMGRLHILCINCCPKTRFLTPSPGLLFLLELREICKKGDDEMQPQAN